MLCLGLIGTFDFVPFFVCARFSSDILCVCVLSFVVHYHSILLYSPDPMSQFRLAIGSYVEQYSNVVQIVKKRSDENSLYVAGEFDHPYPCTKILWSPDVSATKDLLATTGDYLRVWSVTDDGSGTGTVTPTKVALLNNVRSTQTHNATHTACNLCIRRIPLPTALLIVFLIPCLYLFIY